MDTDGAGSGAAADQFFAGFEGINPTLIFDGANSGDLTNRLLWGDIVDELFADEQITNPTNAGNTLWAASDHLGTIRDMVDFNGTAYTVANHRVYDSFGNLTSETNGSVSSLFGFTGKLFDKEFKLSNHWNRWYDPALGKWISEDPIGFAAGDANLARYVGNESIHHTDPTGLEKPASMMDRQANAIYDTQVRPVIKEQKVVERNLDVSFPDLSGAERFYVSNGFLIANILGIRDLSDSFHERDAVDAHVQSLTERRLKLGVGTVSLMGTGLSIQGGLVGPVSRGMTRGGVTTSTLLLQREREGQLRRGMVSKRHWLVALFAI